MKLLINSIMVFFISFSANAIDRSCVGVARILEIIAKEKPDIETEQKYRDAKNLKIKEEGLNKMEAVRVILDEMAIAADIREKEGISADELSERYKKLYKENCEAR